MSRWDLDGMLVVSSSKEQVEFEMSGWVMDALVI
jgi:hypothetical protein